jgi:hypothetical protein
MNAQFKNHKKSYELIRPWTKTKILNAHMHLKFLTLLRQSVDRECELSVWVQVSL